MTGEGERGRLAVLVHELRSPVAALAAIREALAGSGTSPEERAELARLALAAGAAVERIASGVSLASLELEPVDVGRLLHDTARAASLRGAAVRVAALPALPPVLADPMRLRQALDNLLANAHVHTPAGEEIVLDASVAGSELLVSVTDSGPGIPAEEHERIFEPGVRLGSATYDGSGLGLAVVKAVAEAHGGRVLVDSARGAGTTITIALPARAP